MRISDCSSDVCSSDLEEIRNGTLLIEDGRIAAVGAGLAVPDGYTRIDTRGKWVTPGVIDAHSHLGAWAQPETVDANNDVNEMTDPNTAQVWIAHTEGKGVLEGKSVEERVEHGGRR